VPTTEPDQERVSPEDLRLAAEMAPYLVECGWLESRRTKRPVDRDGAPLPWITYPAIDLLAERVQPDMSVFEFGSGNSTMWWAQRVAQVTTVEHDENWAAIVADQVPGNVDFTHIPLEPDGAYCRHAQSTASRFHIIVVDGRDRVNCALQSVGNLRPDGVMVWDNTERSRYRVGLRRLARLGFRRLGLRGPSPINTWASETSILYRPENCLGI
jgi:hypothetical protein